jgi:dTDP-4-dehydrorhamnose 3,5-epimerase-like enzyme
VPFDFERLDIPDVVLVKPKVFRDPRGLLHGGLRLEGLRGRRHRAEQKA